MRMMWALAAVAVLGSPAWTEAELLWQVSPSAMRPVHDGAGSEHSRGQGEQGHSGHRHGRQANVLYLSGAEAVRVELWTPELERIPLPVESDGRVNVEPSGFDSYHLLAAIRDDPSLQELALRYLPLRGRPSGRSPAELTAAGKGALEIVPAPLPREHRRYTAIDDPAEFVIRFRGEPLAGVFVQLQTSIGSLREAFTDPKGRVSFVLPDDFPVVNPGRRNNPPAEFILRVEHKDGPTLYRTTLTAPYHVSPSYWQSLQGGVALAGLGFVVGLVLTGRAKDKKNERVSA